MGRVIFRFVGGCAICFAIVLLLMGVFTVIRYPFGSPRDVLPLLGQVATLLFSGVGLLYLRKWAALIISCITLYIAVFWELKQALHPVPGNADWLAFVFALLLKIPSVLTAKY